MQFIDPEYFFLSIFDIKSGAVVWEFPLPISVPGSVIKDADHLQMAL